MNKESTDSYYTNKIIIFNVILLSFLAGASFSYFKPFPYGEISQYRNYLTKNETKKIGKYEIYNETDFEQVQSKINYINDNYISVRNLLKQKIINNDLIIEKINYNKNIDIYKSKIYGIETKNILTKLENSSNCLNIYIHGHDEIPYKFNYYKDFLNYSINIKCDTLTMSPIGYGLNEGKSAFPIHRQFVTLSAEESKVHSFYSYYTGYYDPLSLFISGHYNVINKLSKNYSKIAITGISGGGWYATWLAALLPQIDLTVIYAGSMPLKYHYANNQGDFPAGDWEQTGSKIYNAFDYWELYKLTTKSGPLEKKRKSYIIDNADDPCCFREPFSSNFKLLVGDIKTEMPTVIIDKSSEHSINNALLQVIYSANNFR